MKEKFQILFLVFEIIAFDLGVWISINYEKNT